MASRDVLDPYLTGTERRRSTLLLEEEDAHAARAGRLHRLHAWNVPLLRILGFNTIALLAVPLHQAFLQPGDQGAGWLVFLLAVNLYCLLTWGLLRAFYREGALDLALVVFVLDLVPLGVAIHLTGGTASWLFWLPLVRVVDQVVVTARRTLAFGALAVVTWLVVAAVNGAGSATPWGPELVKAVLLGAVAGYAVLAARAAERLRERTASAVRVGRHLVGQLRARSRELEEERQKAERENRARSAALAEVSRALVRATSGGPGSAPGPATLRAIVAELGELAEREAGLHELTLKPVRLGRVVERVLAVAEPVALENGVRLEWSAGTGQEEVLADARALHRAILNLVRFAVARSAPVGRVRLWSQSREGRVRLGVADSAATPADEEAAVLRGDEAPTGGRAGLTFAAALTRDMGGRTGAETHPDGGGVYWMELPAVPAAAPTSVS